jgi:hypothetical protein
VLVRFNAPLPANPRVEYFFEHAPFGNVLEDYRSKRCPIQAAVGKKNSDAEFLSQLLLHLLNIDKVVRGLVGIEEFGIRKNLAETLTKSALARGNSARDSDCWHTALPSLNEICEKEKRPVG